MVAPPALLLRWLCALARELGWGNGAENIFIFFLLFFFFLFRLFFFLSFLKIEYNQS